MELKIITTTLTACLYTYHKCMLWYLYNCKRELLLFIQFPAREKA